MRFKDFWDRLTLKNKIGVYTGLVFFIIMLAFLLDAFILKLFVSDFNDIMADNLVGGQLVAAIADETKSFDEYIKGSDPDETAAYDACVEATLHSIKKIPLNYAYLGENRYAQMEALTNAYTTYCSARNQVATDYRSEKLLVDKLYDVYDMQKYLSLYAQK
ncbi:MAG: hypothetical protein K6G10_08135, partial [Butyrivibrio sp.]|nr:hypothetical protein [Butyrivibrio sp.]